MYLFLKQIVDDHESGNKSENLAPFLKKAYEDTLKMYHGWLIQKVFSVRILPFRYIFDRRKSYAMNTRIRIKASRR